MMVNKCVGNATIENQQTLNDCQDFQRQKLLDILQLPAIGERAGTKTEYMRYRKIQWVNARCLMTFAQMRKLK